MPAAALRKLLGKTLSKGHRKTQAIQATRVERRRPNSKRPPKFNEVPSAEERVAKSEWDAEVENLKDMPLSVSTGAGIAGAALSYSEGKKREKLNKSKKKTLNRHRKNKSK